MALGHHQKTPQLLDMLIHMNDLVQTLVKSDVGTVIKNIKNESENLRNEQAKADAAKLQAEMSIGSLKKAEQDALEAAEIVKNETALQEVKKHETEKAIKKLEGEKLALETAKKLHEGNVLEHQKKVQELAAREAKVIDAGKAAAALKAEYEKKMAYIKNIPV
jgi:hypothetical protein